MGSTSSRPQVPDNWDASRIPSQKGKLTVVTGGNSGIGYETALQLARHGAHVVLACRDVERGRAAETKIREDLASTGVMGGAYAQTADGCERQFATNHLGHFALTAQLFDLVRESTPARIVNVSSMVHRHALWTFDQDNIMATSEREYSQWLTYANTKLCNILFTFELDRRMKAAGIGGIAAVACHPGTTSTSNCNLMWTTAFKLWTLMPRQSVEIRALPTLYAATGSEVEGGDFFGPKNLSAVFGYPVRETPSKSRRPTTASTKL
ncbi:hypothetical protein PHYPSEUDO_006730 [Phytophthora pseudosyringae]|uniref:Uncharacterized protein n=1 Tax=Phytophthora pseudosyringae TaxID=221518 RepID=A0A8T1VHR8_9STRA|nr:hypothetical protein PHYPSEUDO_006730 [Phytophthora pseudosyringae]